MHLNQDRHALATCLSFVLAEERGRVASVCRAWATAVADPIAWRGAHWTIGKSTADLPAQYRGYIRKLTIQKTDDLASAAYLSSFESVEELDVDTSSLLWTFLKACDELGVPGKPIRSLRIGSLSSKDSDFLEHKRLHTVERFTLVDNEFRAAICTATKKLKTMNSLSIPAAWTHPPIDFCVSRPHLKSLHIDFAEVSHLIPSLLSSHLTELSLTRARMGDGASVQDIVDFLKPASHLKRFTFDVIGHTNHPVMHNAIIKHIASLQELEELTLVSYYQTNCVTAADLNMLTSGRSHLSIQRAQISNLITHDDAGTIAPWMQEVRMLRRKKGESAESYETMLHCLRSRTLLELSLIAKADDMLFDVLSAIPMDSQIHKLSLDADTFHEPWRLWSLIGQLSNLRDLSLTAAFVSDASPAKHWPNFDRIGRCRRLAQVQLDLTGGPSMGVDQIKVLTELPKLCILDTSQCGLDLTVKNLQDLLSGSATLAEWHFRSDESEEELLESRKEVWQLAANSGRISMVLAGHRLKLPPPQPRHVQMQQQQEEQKKNPRRCSIQ